MKNPNREVGQSEDPNEEVGQSENPNEEVGQSENAEDRIFLRWGDMFFFIIKGDLYLK